MIPWLLQLHIMPATLSRSFLCLLSIRGHISPHLSAYLKGFRVNAPPTISSPYQTELSIIRDRELSKRV
jgi:hypothetical protein